MREGEVAFAWPALVELDISFSQVCDAGLRAIARGCPALEALTARQLARATRDGIRDLAAGCARLTRLDIAENEDGWLVGVGQSRSASLASLSVRSNHGVSTAGLQALARGCPSLRHLDFGLSSYWSGALLASALLVPFPSVKSVFWGGWGGGSNEGNFGAIVRVCPNLDKLKGRLPRGAISQLAAHCKKLRELRLLNRLGVEQWKAGSFPQLQYLLLHTMPVRDEDLVAIAASCPMLQCLEVHECSELTLEGVAHVVSACRDLRLLRVPGCHALDADSVLALARRSGSLKRVQAPSGAWLRV